MRKITNDELNRLSPQQYKQKKESGVVVVLDNVRSAQNVGAFFRTADSFGIDKIVLCGFTPVPPAKEIHKTALGAELVVEWERYDQTFEAVRDLKEKEYKVLAVEQVDGAVMLNEFERDTKKVALVFGNEVDGVMQEVVDVCDGAIEIPQVGTKHSLNVSVAAGVVMWEVTKIKNK